MRTRTWLRWHSIAALAAAALLAGACGDAKQAREHNPLVIIGIDGLEWRIARPLVENGEMPHLRGLIERGASGYLFTRKPAKSPVIWTTIATGTRPQHHGILDFMSPEGVTYTSESRRGKALWNIASDYDLRSLTVGWWVTWPAEQVNGIMVAPYSAAGQNLLNWKGNLYPGLEGQTWPPDLLPSLLPLAEQVVAREELTRLRALYFGDVDAQALFADMPAPRRDEERAEMERLIGQVMWSVAADETYLRVAKHLIAQEGERFPDLTMLYFGAPDVASHRFWRYMEPEAFAYEVPADAVAMCGDVIRNFYRRADAIIGEVLVELPPQANVIVCSDHGFHADFTDRRHELGVSGHHLDGPAGILVAAGPDVRAGMGAKPFREGGKLLDLGYVDDVHPIALHLLGIPIGRNIEDPSGGPLREILRKDFPAPTQVASHDEGFRPPLAPRSAGAEFDAAVQEWMAQNGYLAGGGADNERVGPARSSAPRARSDKDGR